MDLEDCHTLANLSEKVKLYLKEEICDKQISYIDVAQERDQEFCVQGKTMTRLRLLPGPGRDRTYENFLTLLKSVPPRGKNLSFKIHVHIKGS